MCNKKYPNDHFWQKWPPPTPRHAKAALCRVLVGGHDNTAPQKLHINKCTGLSLKNSTKKTDNGTNLLLRDTPLGLSTWIVASHIHKMPKETVNNTNKAVETVDLISILANERHRFGCTDLHMYKINLHTCTCTVYWKLKLAWTLYTYVHVHTGLA